MYLLQILHLETPIEAPNIDFGFSFVGEEGNRFGMSDVVPKVISLDLVFLFLKRGVASGF